MSAARRLTEPDAQSPKPREATASERHLPELTGLLREAFRAEQTQRGRIEASLSALLDWSGANPEPTAELLGRQPGAVPSPLLQRLAEIVESVLGTLPLEPSRRRTAVLALVEATEETIRAGIPVAAARLVDDHLAAVLAAAPEAEAPPHSRRPRADQIAAGYHGLTPDEVLRSQAERIVRATYEAIGAFGYPATRLEDITELAGVSRKTVYKLYGSRELCLLACHERTSARLAELAEKACAGRTGWPERLRAALEALLHALAHDPNGARLCFVETLTAGPEPLRRRDSALDELAAIVGGGERWPRPLVRVGFAGGLGEILQRELAAGRGALLPELLPELAYALTLPLAGPEAAQRQLEPAAER